jgi:cytochrome c oxidase subunit IV
MPDHVIPVPVYLLVCAVLLVLTAGTIGLAHVNLHGLNAAVALAIAAAKAVLIALFFMHLRWSPAITRVVGLAALLWLAILMVGTLDDVLTRGWLPMPGK